MSIDLSASFYIKPIPKMSYMDYASTSDIIDFEQDFCLIIRNTELILVLILLIRMPLMLLKHTRIERYYREMLDGNMTEAEVNQAINAMRDNDYRREAQKY